MRPAAESNQKRIERFERACRERGLSVTVKRRAVLEMILERRDHPTAEEVYGDIRSRLPTVSRTTVYRILSTLVRLGSIAKVCHPGSAARFEPRLEPHDHLVCTHCERIIDIERKPLDEVEWPDVRRQGFEIRGCEVHFRGLCRECRRRLTRAPERGRRGGGVRARAQARRPDRQGGAES